MASAVDVVDISSDDEDFFPVTKKLPADPDGWIAGLLQEDERVILDGYDDLMVMGELSAPPVSQKKGNKPVGGGGGGSEDDDDCVVLDCDPDKVMTVAEEDGSAGDGSSDELQIVAEKGPVACRDFPHSRHLCSNLSFATTSHVKHCSMCHCFVCDAPAPCTYWGKGNSINDHCHATDKEAKWKALRQAFKCKSLPTSHPEKHQNGVYPPMAFRQQDTQCQILECGISSIQSYTSFPNNQSHLLNVESQSQNQQGHASVTVSPNVGRTVSSPRPSPVIRTGRSTSNAPAVPITQSRTRFKRAGATSPGRATVNFNMFGPASPNNALVRQASGHVSQPVQVAPRTNSLTGTFQNKPPQRSLSAPIAFQGQQPQSASSYQAASNGMHGTGPQFSRCTSLTTQKTQVLPEPAMDVCAKTWEDILASVASDLGVPDYNAGIGMSQQPVITFPQSMHPNAYQGVGLHSESVASTANLMSSDGRDLSNGTTGGNVQANGPAQTTQAPRLLNRQSSLIPDGAHLNNSESAPADALLMEAAHQRDMPELDSTDIIFDFELEGWG